MKITELESTMSYSISALLRGLQFYTGLRIAVGLLFLISSVYLFAGLDTALRACAGGLCVSAADQASPLRHKRRELIFSWLFSSCVFLLILSSRGMVHILGLEIVVLSFFIAMSAVYGPKAGPVGFSCTFAIVLALGSPAAEGRLITDFAGAFCLGGGIYVAYSFVTTPFLTYKTKQQIFAECCFEFSRYLRIKAAFYEKNAPLDALYLQIASQQAALVAKQQRSREFLFRDIKKDRDARLARLFIAQVDLFEAVLASNTDYEVLQKNYSGSDAMLFLRDLVYKCAKAVDHVAFTALEGKSAPFSVNFKAELFAIEHELDRMSYDRTQDLDALTMLIDAFDKILLCTEKIQEIIKIQKMPLEQRDPAVTLRLSLFTTASSFSPRLVLKNLNMHSPHFRYACRATIAMCCGYLVSLTLMYFAEDFHIGGYWILLTISVVLRSNFTTTAQRRTDRIIGTAAGCALTALLLYLAPPVGILVAAVFASQVLVITFVNVNYRVAAAAASVIALIQISLLNPGAGVLLEARIVDTVIGAFLAYGCSFIFPNWEYRSLPQLANELYCANARYANAVLDVDHVGDEQYRLARQAVLSAVSEMAESFERMRREPKTKRRDTRDIGVFITLNALFSYRLASIHTLFGRITNSPLEDALLPRVNKALAKMEALFSPECEITGGACREALATAEIKEPEEQDEAALRLELDKMDYADQHIAALLQKQLDSALAMAGEINNLKGVLAAK